MSTDTITINDVSYDVERSTDQRDGSEHLTIAQFPGIEGTLGYEESGDGMSPREDSNVGTMAVSYGGYDLGDEDISKIDFDVKCDKCVGSGESEHWIVGIHNTAERLVIGSYEECETYLYDLPLDDLHSGRYYIEPLACDKCKGEGTIPLNPVDYFKQQRGARVVLGLTVYEHSGITMSAGDVTFPWDGDRWDTSFVGFIFDTPEGVKGCIGDNATDEQIEAALESEVKVYASYLEGDVTYWSVNDDETDFSDGCGGYVGDSDHCEQECFAALEAAIIKRLAEITERAEMAARDIITV